MQIYQKIVPWKQSYPSESDIHRSDKMTTEAIECEQVKRNEWLIDIMAHLCFNETDKIARGAFININKLLQNDGF